MKRAIRLVFTDETDWATVLEALRQTVQLSGKPSEPPTTEEIRAQKIALWARAHLDRPREEAKKP
jgi:hypothetical protein